MARALILFLAAIAFAISPLLSPEFGGFDPDRYPIPQNDPPVQPAGWAFAIWGVIYLWLLVHAGHGLLRRRDDPEWHLSRGPLIISFSVGAIWLPVALVSPIWATVLIWVMLITALWGLERLRVAKPSWAGPLPLGLYAGWLTAASFVSIGLFGAGYGIAFGEVGWAIIALGCATLFALVFQFRFRVWTYALAVIWGIAGIVAQNYATNPQLAALAGVAALLIAVVSLRQTLGR